MIVKGYDYSSQVPKVIIDDPIDCPEPYQESFGPTLEDRILDEAYSKLPHSPVRYTFPYNISYMKPTISNRFITINIKQFVYLKIYMHIHSFFCNLDNKIQKLF